MLSVLLFNSSYSVGGQVTGLFVHRLRVVEADSVERLVLGVFIAAEAAPVDELALEGRDPGVEHRVGRRRLLSI